MPLSERRQAQLGALIDAAERRIAEGGMANLKARDLAADIGIALGGLCAIVADLDELSLHVSSRTLARLGEALTATSEALPLKRGDAVNVSSPSPTPTCISPGIISGSGAPCSRCASPPAPPSPPGPPTTSSASSATSPNPSPSSSPTWTEPSKP